MRVNGIRSLSLPEKVNYLALVVFVLTAWFSIGHNKSDEHYQILEFAQYQLGKINAAELPWEFNEKMRPTLQPWIVVVVVKSFHAIGINNPFTITKIFRLITALLVWFVTINLNGLLIKKYFKNTTWAIIFSCATLLLWYVPFISVRFSSESYSEIFLLAGLYFLVKDPHNTRNIVLTGILLGISILFKAQIGVAVLGIFSWMYFKERIDWSKLFLMIPLFLLVILFGTYLDSLFYNKLVFTPFNFIKANLMNGRASEFGTAPFYYYLLAFLMVCIPPLSLALPFSFFSGLSKLKDNVLVWALLPYILVHCFIDHKEIRFLLPVIYLISFITIYGLASYFKERSVKKYHRVLFKVAILFNSLALIYMMLKPANGTVLYQQYLYENSKKGNSTVITTDRDYYKIMGNLQTTFYRPDNIKSYKIESQENLSDFLKDYEIKKCFYVHRGISFTEKIPGYTVTKVYGLYPKSIADQKWFDTKFIRTDCIYLITKM